MTGKELIEIIKKNNWEDADVWIGVQGYIGKIENVEAMFPKLSNTNEIMVSDNCEVEKDDYFWKTYYGSYLDLIPENDADLLFHDGDRSIVICPLDGTEHYIPSDTTEEQWNELKDSGCLFGLEKED